MYKQNDTRYNAEEPRPNANIYLASGQQLMPQPYYPVAPQGMGTSQQPLSNPIDRLSKRAPVCCNCCKCTHDSCAQTWAILNLVQVYMCYFIIAIRHLGWEYANSLVEDPKSHKDGECWELYHVLGTPKTNITFSIEILLLMVYTIGSIFFAAAVFHESIGPQQRAKFLLIFIVLLASLPLAYLIPLIIRFYWCVKAGVGNLVQVCGWFIVIMTTTICAANVAWVLRNWVLADDQKKLVPFVSQPQIVGSTATTSTSEEQDNGQGTN